ncbi:MAG: acyl-CoA synthetase [Gemmatimonas sp.]|jgi:predicted LPLAT superfamily acyltransferase|nr:acyl-CoA synthetase [Rubrivivax sp.]
MSAASTPRDAAARPEWLARRERSNRLALALMAWVATTLGRRFARVLLHPIALYFLVFSPTAARHSQRYLQRVLDRRPGWRERYRHFHCFASVVLDRVYFARGQMHLFEIDVQGGPRVDETLALGQGAFMLGAHFGSFEALHAIGATRPGMRVAHVMYPGNAEMIQRALAAIAPGFAMSIIEIGRAGSTLAIRDWLDNGGLVGLLGDRWMPPTGTAASARDGGVVVHRFLGQDAAFTDGPLRLAQVLRRRVLLMTGLYRGGNRYELRFEPLADFSQPMIGPDGQPLPREAALAQAQATYVARLEGLCHEAPYNWFNFYDYWALPAPRGEAAA